MVRNSKHTPLPWEIGESFSGRPLVCHDGSPLAEVPRLADAQLIVRAVNCHEDFLAACKAAQSLLYKLGGTNYDPEYSELCAAVAKATGR